MSEGKPTERYASFVTSAAARSKSWPIGPDCIASMSATWNGASGMWPLENIIKSAKALSVHPRDLFADFS